MTHISTPADTRPHSDRFRGGGRESKFLAVVILTLSLGLFVFTARADVRPHALCAEGMVLQQQTEAKIWGAANPGEVVTVTFRGKQASATAGAGGRWVVAIPAGEAGGPFEMTIVGKNTLSYKNVLVGEVWLCSGQSNMDWAIGSGDAGDKALATESNPMLRLFTVQVKPKGEPQLDISGPLPKGMNENRDAGGTTLGPSGSWHEARPETITRFSGVAYSFGRHLQKHRKVPVGLILASCGGTRIQTWISASAIEPFEKPKADEKPVSHNDRSALYNGMIHPLLNYRLRGAIWYQGESNAAGSEAFNYRNLLSAMIRSWRIEFRNPGLAFHIVQLPPNGSGPAPAGIGHESGWGLLRESQTLAALLHGNTGLAVITDFGGSIHPNPKRPAGERLGLAARGITYGEKIVFSGPMLKSVKFDGEKAILGFAHTGGGLVAREMALTPKADSFVDAYRVKEGATGRTPLLGFTMCGRDAVFQPAEAEIVGDTVVVTSGKVPAPTAVRYGWGNYPVCNLFNREGLPASPFRTETLITTLKLSAGPGGTVSPGAPLAVTRGMETGIAATSRPGYVFAKWTVLRGTAAFADSNAANTTVAIPDEAAIRADFITKVRSEITGPATPALVKAGASLTIKATASVLGGNSKVRKVEFFRDDIKIGEAASAPYSCEWSNVPAGTHALTTKATDDGGLAGTSAPVYVVATASGRLEGIHATGGSVTHYTEGGTHWTAHTFTQSGTLDVGAAGEAEYLIVAGGGGGGGTFDGGGGGAGGFLAGKLMLSKNNYTVRVGAGGNGEGQPGGKSNGGDSFLALKGEDVLRATGGGFGGSSAPGSLVASNGGSGGGGSHGAAKGAGIAGPPRQGHDGGTAGSGDGAGGGGAGGVGQAPNGTPPRAGGAGRASIFQDGVTASTYATGGTGKVRPRDFPLVVDGGSKADNTGDGGDGGSSSQINPYIGAKGGNGGSGIVIVRYVTGGK